ncbi:MAG TPA: SRPBCC family protein [Kineosporiaceae bacterium]
MPTDEASRTVEVTASFDQVLATIRDVGSQVTWVPEILQAEVLQEYEGGLPATAHFRAQAPVGTDEYTLEYEHSADGMTWSLVSGRLQTGQDGAYAVRAVDDGRTAVTFRLRISHHLPLPGFVRSRVIKGLVDSTLNGLKNHLENGTPAR